MVALGWAAADALARRLADRLRRRGEPAVPLGSWAVNAAASVRQPYLGFDGTRADTVAMTPKRPPYRPTVQVLEVVAVEFNRGEGVLGDPVRNVVGYYGRDGQLLAESDTWADRNQPDLPVAARRAQAAAARPSGEWPNYNDGVVAGVAAMEREVARLLGG